MRHMPGSFIKFNWDKVTTRSLGLVALGHPYRNRLNLEMFNNLPRQQANVEVHQISKAFSRLSVITSPTGRVAYGDSALERSADYWCVVPSVTPSSAFHGSQ